MKWVKIINYPLVSVIILAVYGKSSLMIWDSILRTNYPNFEIILVIDRVSPDIKQSIISKFKGERVKVICNPVAVGISKARNIGASLARGKYLVFLDDDTEIIDPEWLSKLVCTLENDPTIGAAMCGIQQRSRIILGTYANYLILLDYPDIEKDYSKLHEIFSVMGAAFITRRDVWRYVGGFDNDIVRSFDEDDFCWRVWLAGYRVVVVPEAKIFHKGSGIVTGRRKVNYFERHRLMSILKNYSLFNLIKYLPLYLLIKLGSWLIRREFRNIKDCLLWNLINLKGTMEKRRVVQQKRRVSDEYLMRRGVIKRLCLKLF